MPELPEVETTRLSLAPIVGSRVHKVAVHFPRLRWDIPTDLSLIQGTVLQGLSRRAKHLIFDFGAHKILAHLGMSGSFRLCAPAEPLRKHDHISIDFETLQLRYHDPRRFGAFVWFDAEQQQRLLALAPEPLTNAFTADYLQQQLARCPSAIKKVIMDQKYVVGVGNIYATEVLFSCNIHPLTPANTITPKQCQQIVLAIKHTLSAAIALGGSSLKDYVNAVGENGYFQQTLQVYAKKTQPCPVCNTPIQSCMIAQRASSYCPRCQPLVLRAFQ